MGRKSREKAERRALKEKAGRLLEVSHGRNCSDCQECCWLPEIPDFEKLPYERCPHQCETGCGITKEQAFYLAGRDLVRDHYKCVLGRPEGCPSLTISEPPCSDGKGRYNFICVGGGQRYHIRIALAGDLAVRLAKARKESTDPVVSLVAALRDMSLVLAYPFEDFSWFDDGHDLRDDYREALRQAQVAPKVYQHDRYLMACGQVSLAIVELAHHLTEAWTELERRVNSILADGIKVTKTIEYHPDRGGYKK